MFVSLQLSLSSSLQQEEDTPPPTPQNKRTKVPPETKPKPVTPPPVTAPPAAGEDEDDGDKIMAELQVRSASSRHPHVHTSRKRKPFSFLSGGVFPTARPSLLSCSSKLSCLCVSGGLKVKILNRPPPFFNIPPSLFFLCWACLSGLPEVHC